MTAGDLGTTPGGAIFNERYEVVAPISIGAMGAVYRAVDLASGGEVAIKRMLDVKHAARFEIEAQGYHQTAQPRLLGQLLGDGAHSLYWVVRARHRN